MSIPYIRRGNTMPSENTFKNQVELVRAYLTAFEAIIKLDAPVATNSALMSLSDATGNFHHYIPYFDNRPLYIETISMAYIAMDNFFTKNPTVEKPHSFKRVAGLYGHAKNLSPAER